MILGPQALRIYKYVLVIDSILDFSPKHSVMDVQYCFNQPLALRSIKERFFYRYGVLTALTILPAVASSTLGVVGFIMLEDKDFA